MNYDARRDEISGSFTPEVDIITPYQHLRERVRAGAAVARSALMQLELPILSDGAVFTVRMDLDIAGRSAQYRGTYPGAGPGVFRIVIGDDGTWVATLEIRRPDQTRFKVMEFRMKRLTERAER